MDNLQIALARLAQADIEYRRIRGNKAKSDNAKLQAANRLSNEVNHFMKWVHGE